MTIDKWDTLKLKSFITGKEVGNQRDILTEWEEKNMGKKTKYTMKSYVTENKVLV